MSVQDLKKELFKDKGFKKYFEQHRRSYEIAVKVMSERISKGMSQGDLAKKVGTKQPSIARLERGSYLPSLRFLEKIEKALEIEIFSIKSPADKRETASVEIKSILIMPYSATPGNLSVSYISDSSGKKYEA